MKKFWLCTLLACLTACTKNKVTPDLPGPNGFRGWEYTMQLEFLDGTRQIVRETTVESAEFKFNKDQTVNHIIVKHKDRWREYQVYHWFSYNNGLLVAVRSYCSDCTNGIREFQFLYNGSALVGLKNERESTEDTFETDSKGRVTVWNEIPTTLNPGRNGINKYTWYEDNLLMTHSYVMASGGAIEKARAEYTYDGYKYNALPLKSIAEKWYVVQYLNGELESLLSSTQVSTETNYNVDLGYMSGFTRHYYDFQRDSIFRLKKWTSRNEQYFRDGRKDPNHKRDYFWTFLYQD